MEDKDKSAGENLMEWVKEVTGHFINFLKPAPEDNIALKIVKSILKIPVAIFVILVSPILLLLLGIIFVILL